MTVNRGLFVRNIGTVGTTPIESRLALAALVARNASGAPRTGLLNPPTTNVVTGTTGMQYSISSITPVISRAADEGVYIFTLTGTTLVSTLDAPTSGARYDLIYVKQNDPDKLDADSDGVTRLNTATVGVVSGDSALNPTRPTSLLPPGAYVLAEALVAAGTSSTNAATVTISQVWRYTALAGEPIPVRGVSERAELTAEPGLRVKRLDAEWTEEYMLARASRGTADPGRPAGWYPVAGHLPSFEVALTNLGTIPNNASTDLGGYATADRSVWGDSIYAGSGYFTLNMPGRWLFTASISYPAAGASTKRILQILASGSGNNVASQNDSAGGSGQITTVFEYLSGATSDQVKAVFFQNSGASMASGTCVLRVFRGVYLGPN